MKRIEEIKERLSKVKDVPWKRSKEYSHDYYYQGYSVESDGRTPQIADCIEEIENADLIANAPTDIHYLLSLIDRYKKALEKYADMIVLDSEDHPHDVGMVAREALEDHS
jgi:hypothetical protein